MEEHFETPILNEVQMTSEDLSKLWEDIGYSEQEKEMKCSGVVEQVKDVLKKAYTKELKHQTSLVKQIEKNLNHVYRLSQILDLPNEMSEITNISSNLLQTDYSLQDRISQLNTQVQKQRQLYKDLEIQQRELCERLHEEPLEIQFNIAPTKQQIAKVEQNINALEQEKEHRELQLGNMKREILLLMKELEMIPRSPFEMDALSEINDMVPLSRKTLEKLRSLKDELNNKIDENERTLEDLMTKVNNLYDRLSIDMQEREEFFDSLPIRVPVKINKLRDEEARLTTIRQENMISYIQNVRKEIGDWWDKCYIGEEWRSTFKPCFGDEYTDNVLELLENELDRLKTYYPKVEKVLTKLELRQKLWRKLMELNEQASNPNRLFGNRGCSLLQEEKERKKVNLELPKVERELEILVENYETTTGEKFCLDGVSVGEYIQKQWNEYNEQKDKEKMSRIISKAKQIEYEAQMGSLPRKSQIGRANLTRAHGGDMSARKSSLNVLRQSVMKSPGIRIIRESTNRSRLSPRILKDQNSGTPGRRKTPKKVTNDTSSISSYSQFSAYIKQNKHLNSTRMSRAEKFKNYVTGFREKL